MPPKFLFKRLLDFVLSLCLVVIISIPLWAQSPRHQIRSKVVNDNPLPGLQTRNQVPVGLVYISQKIDLSQQLSNEEIVFSLDGEPVPHLQSTSVTLGILIDDEGTIVTRLANIPGSESTGQLRVYVNGKRLGQSEARFVGMDSVTGLCVIKVDRQGFAETAKISPLAKYDSLPLQRQVQLQGFHPRQSVGQPGISVVMPRIFSTTATLRKASDDFRFSNSNPFYRISTSAPLTPIQDCSLIVEKDGTIFGLVAFDTSGEGGHLVYPITRVQKLATLIIQDRLQAKRNVVPHAWLGATGNGPSSPITSGTDLAPEIKGIQIASVFPDSPAELAGIRPSDILMSIGGRALTTGRDLRDTLQMLPADSEVTLKVRRNKELKTLQAKLVPAPALDARQQVNWIVSQVEEYEQNVQKLPPADPRREEIEKKKNTMIGILNQLRNSSPPEIHLRVRYGIEVLPLTQQLAKHFSAPSGVLVSRVNSLGKSLQAGLQVGDVIVKVGEQPVADINSLFQAINAEKSEPMELLVIRDGQAIKINMAK